jgi:hypothetical protein
MTSSNPRQKPPNVVRLPRARDIDLETITAAERRPPSRITGWLYQREDVAEHEARPWYQVLCLTGVDYFSTLGYQPGIAFLAAGLLSPIATLVLVLFTLVAALPTYMRVASESPHGQGSIAMLEHLLPRWRGKLLVLCLLGFGATSFIITITLSAADATAHVVENPFAPHIIRHNVVADIAITTFLIAVLGGIFLKGFKEAIGIAVALVVVYLSLNFIVIARAMTEIAAAPAMIGDWRNALFSTHASPLAIIAVALLVFPKLALGLSGFETGVAVMPLVRGDEGDTERQPDGRIRNTKKLLATAAAIMSVYLMTSSIVTTLLIPAEAHQDGGDAHGRALAYLAHRYLGDIFGTVYDLSTISILWFAGSSAMAGLLNLVPRYLPGYGMAPKWAAAQRPLVLVFTAISIAVTLLFRADVTAQGSAYATGVLVFMASASVAVALTMLRRGSQLKWAFVAITLAFLYITVQNIRVQPTGLIIATIFIAAIIVISVISRVSRATELRHQQVMLDRDAERIIKAAIRNDRLLLVTHDPLRGVSEGDYEAEILEARKRHYLPPDEVLPIVEVYADDPSVFGGHLVVSGVTVGRYQLLRCTAPAVANAIAALALAIHGQYGCVVHLNMRWTPIPTLMDAVAEGIQFLLWGGGDTARIVELEIRRESPTREAVVVHAA